MKYLSLTAKGIWHFRFQVPSRFQHLFKNRKEINRSLRTSDLNNAKVGALSLELEIRKIMSEGLPTFEALLRN